MPEAEATGQLLLAPRDPRCLYAHWDITLEQQRAFNTLSIHHHLLIRVHRESLSTSPVCEVHVHPESRHWFIHVPHSGARYVGVLGYYRHGLDWVAIAASSPVQTPRDSLAEDDVVRFATVLPDEPPVLWEQPQPFPQPQPAPEAGNVLPASGDQSRVADWTPDQAQVLVELVTPAQSREDWIGSIALAELTHELVQRGGPQARMAGAADSMAAPQFGQAGPRPEAASSPTSPPSPAPKPAPRFWFQVNAELVLYGATEPGAQVTIANRPIRLRPDGTFSYRFTLPDGDYELPICARAAHGDERRAELKFHRASRYSGPVEAHSQDPSLNPPLPENAS